MDAPAPRATACSATFPAISDYGVIGNLETVALVANTGAVEFFCYPRFDSPSIFAAMLDRNAGAFTVSVAGAPVGTARYLEGSNVLVTRFVAPDGVVEITDFMPVGKDACDQLVRIVACVAGTAVVDARCRPAFDYARGRTVARRRSDTAVVFEDGGTSAPLRLVADRPVALEDGVATVAAHLRDGERVVLVTVADDAQEDLLSRGTVDAAFDATVAFWRDWLGQTTYAGEFRDAVLRSALALKLMVSDANGSIVAAATMALPETIGGERNWDYRYCWLRDSAFTIYALIRLGFTAEADSYRGWVRDRLEEHCDGTVSLMYRVDGTSDGMDEVTLDHLSGYRGSRPVRLGNGAVHQSQHDIYGEMVDTLYLAHGHVTTISERTWRNMHLVVGEICRSWSQPGNGFWEMRGPPQQFLDAHLMSWVGIDRSIRLAGKTGRAPEPEWLATRAEIARVIEEEFFNPAIGAYTQVKGGDRVDAVALLMPLMKFVSTTDDRFRSTLAVLEERLVAAPFVRRYEACEDLEGLDGPPEGHFVACSFWYIEVLARSRRVDEARALFGRMLSYASPLGLFAEEIADDGAHLGNTPQALSHLSLVSAAVALSRAAANGGEPF